MCKVLRESWFKTLHLHRRLRPLVAKHSDRKSTVSAIGYCPNASPLLFQQALINAKFCLARLHNSNRQGGNLAGTDLGGAFLRVSSLPNGQKNP